MVTTQAYFPTDIIAERQAYLTSEILTVGESDSRVGQLSNSHESNSPTVNWHHFPAIVRWYSTHPTAQLVSYVNLWAHKMWWSQATCKAKGRLFGDFLQRRCVMARWDVWCTNLESYFSPLLSTLRQNCRVERCSQRITYILSPDSASFRGWMSKDQELWSL